MRLPKFLTDPFKEGVYASMPVLSHCRIIRRVFDLVPENYRGYMIAGVSVAELALVENSELHHVGDKWSLVVP